MMENLSNRYLPSTTGPFTPPPPTGIRPNPLAAGVQLGVAGAAGGLGYAAIKRALLLKAGKQTKVSVLKPVLMGALIGTAMGAATSQLPGVQSTASKATSWPTLADEIESEYYGTKEGMEKNAIAITSILAGLFAVLGGVGAARSGSKAVGAARKGNWRGVTGHGIAAAGEGLLAATGLGVAGKVLSGGSHALRLARMGNMLNKGKKTKALAAIASKINPKRLAGAGMVGSRLQKIVPNALKRIGRAGRAGVGATYLFGSNLAPKPGVPAKAIAPKPARYSGLSKLIGPQRMPRITAPRI